MRLAYDHQIFSRQEYGGVSRYFYELATRLPRLGDYEVRILAPLYINRYLRDKAARNVVGRYIPRIPKTGRAVQILNDKLVGRLLRREKPDVVHETYYRESSLAPNGARTVVTVHDMIHEKFADCFGSADKTSRIKKESIRRADHVICVSENTRKDLIELLGVDLNRTSVVYHGYELYEGAHTEIPPVIDRPYIAYLGVRPCYKNFSGLLSAYALSALHRRGFALVCFGGGPLSALEHEQIMRLGLPANAVIQLAGDDRALVSVYRHAAVYVYPSLYEGFGIPPLEAMSLGCPVACSGTSSLPEVCGDAAQYFDPEDPEAMAAAIKQVVESSDRRAELVRAGYAQVQKYSWDICARQTAAIYERL